MLTHGVGAANTAAVFAIHAPNAELHAKIDAGAVAARTVPKVKPAAA